ncbi:MAG: DUF1993 domain-containing protein [Steroidobacteraceae bacterium]
MTISMYQASVPLITRALTNLRQILVKAEAHAQAKKIDAAVFLNGRIAPDMLPLTKQIQIVSDNAKGIPARLAGIEIPAYTDTEATFEELIARLDKTLAFVAGITPAQVDGSESRKIELKLGPNTVPFTGLSYLTGFALPNLYFHVVTAYAILRHLGVEIGKRDYIGNPQ